MLPTSRVCVLDTLDSCWKAHLSEIVIDGSKPWSKQSIDLESNLPLRVNEFRISQIVLIK